MKPQKTGFFLILKMVYLPGLLIYRIIINGMLIFVCFLSEKNLKALVYFTLVCTFVFSW